MPERNGGQRSQGNYGVEEQSRWAAHKAQENIGRVAQEAHENAQYLGQRAREMYGQAEGLVVSHPGLSILIAAGLGAGVGVLLASFLTQESRHREYERMFDRISGTVSDTIAKMLPEKLAGRFHS